jgi:prepilin-type processing-associated H-X9-DG protein
MAQNGALLVMQPNFVGISGAANGTIPGYTETRIDPSAAGTGCCSWGGPASAGGVFFRGSMVKFTDITDGSSNTAMISEMGTYMVDTNGGKNQWTAGGLYGWSMGMEYNTPPNPAATASDNRQFNCTTIRYTINQTTGWPVGGNCQIGVCQDMGNNIPLNSTHNGSGGVNICMADGSVHWAANSTPISLIAQISVRDDGTGGTLSD